MGKIGCSGGCEIDSFILHSPARAFKQARGTVAKALNVVGESAFKVHPTALRLNNYLKACV